MSKKRKKMNKAKRRKYAGIDSVLPKAAEPRPFTAVRVTRVNPTAVETNRNRH